MTITDKLSLLSVYNRRYRRMMSRIHTAFSTPKNVIIPLVRQATGSGIEAVKRVVNGESNEIYDIRLKDHEHVIMKISWRGYTFAGEKFVTEECLQRNVPVAKILLRKTVTVGRNRLSFCIQKKINGKPLNELLIRPNSDKKMLDAVVKELGTYASRIHGIKTTGFDRLDGSGVGFRKTWTDFMYIPMAHEHELYGKAVRADIPVSSVSRALSLIRQYEWLYGSVTPHLVYGDFNPRNVLVDGYAISGLIDFEDAISGDRVYDFARWDYFYDFHLFKTGLLMQRYDDKETFDGLFPVKLHLYRLRIGMDMLDYFVRAGNTTGLSVVRKNLQSDIHFFRRYGLHG